MILEERHLRLVINPGTRYLPCEIRGMYFGIPRGAGSFWRRWVCVVITSRICYTVMVEVDVYIRIV